MRRPEVQSEGSQVRHCIPRRLDVGWYRTHGTRVRCSLLVVKDRRWTTVRLVPITRVVVTEVRPATITKQDLHCSRCPCVSSPLSSLTPPQFVSTVSSRKVSLRGRTRFRVSVFGGRVTPASHESPLFQSFHHLL